MIQHPLLGAITVPVSVGDTTGIGSPDGSPVVGDSEAETVNITALWLNLPQTRASNSDSASPIDVSVDGWRLRVDERPNLPVAEREARSSRTPLFVTHEASVRRADGEPLTAADGLDAPVGFQMALSFGLGRFVAPVLPKGIDDAGQAKWEGWQDWRCDSRWGVESWLAPLNQDDVTELLVRFMNAWLDPERRPTIRHGAVALVCAHNPKPAAEAGVMLAEAELEVLTWHKLVVGGTYAGNEYRSLSATDRIKQMLSVCSIDTTIPHDLHARLELATGPGTPAPTSGPGVSAWVRNRLTHPKDPTVPHDIESLVWHTRLLLLEYLDLVLLHEIEYSGRWSRLYPPGRWAGKTEPVPWLT